MKYYVVRRTQDKALEVYNQVVAGPYPEPEANDVADAYDSNELDESPWYEIWDENEAKDYL